MDINTEEYDGRLALQAEDMLEEVVDDPTVSMQEDEKIVLSPRQAYP
jgi:hypothetical protein